jgi:hypothetical protein
MIRKSCIFCGRLDRKISNEHAWPNWVRALFPPGKSTITSGPTGGAPRRWIANDDMGVTVNAICKGCNEGWMHALEDAVKPILSKPIQIGGATSFSAEQQGLLAAWSYKTAMVFEFAGHTPTPYYTADERLALSQTSTAPARNVFVTLAGYAAGTLSTAHHHMINYELEDHPTRSSVDARCTTISVGKFAFQVLAMRLPDDVHQLLMPVRGRDWERRTVGIWPNPHPVVEWPPVEILDDRGLASFANRWNISGRADETSRRPMPT